jgi:DNA modification methylase
VSTKAHYGSEHFAIFPEDLIERIISFASENGDWVLDPFMGRGTTGIVCVHMTRNFCGIDLYPENVFKTKENIISASKANADANISNLLKPIAGENITPFAALKSRGHYHLTAD